MKKFYAPISVILALLMIATPLSVFVGVSSASGPINETNAVYQIFTLADLQDMDLDLDGDYILENDIDALDTHSWAGGFDPVGTLTGEFTGNFDGQNYTISNLFSDTGGNSGASLFGFIQGTGITIENLILENVSLVSTAWYHGAIAGYAQGSGLKITNCHVTGNMNFPGGDRNGGLIGFFDDGIMRDCSADVTINGENDIGGLVGWLGSSAGIMTSHSLGTVTGTGDRVGGLVGLSDGSTSVCYSEANVTGKGEVGGFVGENTNSIDDCYSTGTVSGSDLGTGGFAGFGLYQISNSYATGDVTSSFGYTGGFVGYTIALITECYASGNVIGTTSTGGLIGRSNFAAIAVSNCYATGNVEGESSVGGLVGFKNGALENSYSTGFVTASGSDFGGLIGNDNAGAENNCFWDIDTSGQATSDGSEIGHNTSDMMNNFTFDNANWDFVSTWFIVNGSTRPFLKMEYSFEISNSHQLQLMAMGKDGAYTMTDNVDLSDITESNQMWGTSVAGGEGFAPVGNESAQFKGSLDGNWHMISNLYINRSAPADDYQALFGYIDSSVTITNTSLEVARITGYTYVGGLVAFSNGGSISYCNVTATGNISGYQVAGVLVGQNSNGASISNCTAYGNATVTAYNAGGLVGRNSAGATISHSSAQGNISGHEYLGGLVGSNDASTISNSSANGNVSGSGYIGGLIGQNSNAGVITDCHATGIVNGTGDLVGGLIGYNDAGPVSNCSAAGDVSGSSYVGGLVGRNDDTISDSNTLEAYVNGTGSRVGGLVGLNYGDVIECEAHGHVYAVGGNAGGLIGDNNPGTSITNSSAYGDVTTEDIYCGGLTGRNGGIIENSSAYGNADAGTFGYVGGLVGDNMGGTILNSSALGDVDGGIRTGGFVGSNHGGTIERCFSMGDVNALVDQWHGGFIGLNYGASVKDCYSQGNVTGNDQVGGFIGNNSDGSSISNSYSTGFVTGNTNLGGFAGINADNAAVCTITDCTWDNETSGFATTGIGGGAIGSTTGNYTSEMKQQATFDPPWDFTDIWGIYETNTYPFLQTVGLTPIVEADLGLTVETSPLVQVGDPVTYYVNVTNNGLDNALNVNATLIGSGADMIYDGNNQSAVFWGGGLSWEISFLAAGETVWMQINLTANEGGIFTLDGTVTSDIDDPVAGNNDATADVDSNAPPIAVDDIEQTSEDDVKYCWTPGVLANEIGIQPADADPIEVVSHEDSDYGATITIDADGNMTYDPTVSAILQGLHNGEFLNDTFNYTISDGRGGFATALITIEVGGIDDAPTANNDTFTMAEDSGPYSMDVLANDVADEEGDDFYISQVGDVYYGTLTISADGKNLTYESTHTNYTGYEVFIYEISDGIMTSTATVNLTITPTNDAPAITLFTHILIANTNVEYYADYNATDSDGGDLTWLLDTEASWLSINSATGILNGTSADSDIGVYYVNISVEDGNGGSDNVSFRLRVVLDTDGDGDPDSFDTDDDNDGVPDSEDADPLDPSVGAETDTDGDGTPDDEDDFPNDATEDTDTDGDGTGDNADEFPNDATEDTDTDGDGTGDNGDAFPDDAAASVDADDDGLPDAWNDGYTADDSTTGLVIDDDPLNADDDTSSNTWLYLIIILVIVGAIAGYMLMRGKGKEPVIEEPVEETPQEIIPEEAPIETEEIVEPETIE